MRRGTILNRLDWVLVVLFFALVLLGWANIYAAVYNEEHQNILDISQKYGKQLLWILTALALIALILMVESSLFQTLAYPIFGISMLSLLLLFVFGKEIAGARSWYAFGSFSIQPSEFAKIAAALAVSKYLSTKGVSLNNWSNRLTAFGIALLPALIIIPQPDPGSALVYASFFLVFYREGLSGNYLFLGFSMAILFILSLLIKPLYLFIVFGGAGLIALWFYRKSRANLVRIVAVTVLSIGFIQSVDYTFNNILEDRHRNRINILLGKAHDPKGIGYNTNQSMIAIGSGGVLGKGYLQGTQTKFDFVPEQSTDFIFCTVGEEWGLLGSSAVILLFVLLFFRILAVAERQKSAFNRIYGYCVASILFFHFAINIAMTIGLAPVIGIPLPFFSYGGSSLWGFTILLFVFIKLDSSRMDYL